MPLPQFPVRDGSLPVWEESRLLLSPSPAPRFSRCWLARAIPTSHLQGTLTLLISCDLGLGANHWHWKKAAQAPSRPTPSFPSSPSSLLFLRLLVAHSQGHLWSCMVEMAGAASRAPVICMDNSPKDAQPADGRSKAPQN